MGKKLDKQKELNKIVKTLFKGITKDDVLKQTPKGLQVGDTVLPVKDVEALIQQAQSLSQSFLWKLLLRDATYQANLMMFDNASSYEDMYFGKAVLYVVDLFEKRIDELGKAVVKTPTPKT